MPQEIGVALMLFALLDWTYLYGRVVRRRIRQRRIRTRLAQSTHLYGLVRTALADQRFADQT